MQEGIISQGRSDTLCVAVSLVGKKKKKKRKNIYKIQRLEGT